MPKYIIDTDNGTVTAYQVTPASAGATGKGETMVRTLSEHRGDVEYTGFVAEIQKWFYGSVVKASWCATTISYMLHKIGIEIKKENVKGLLDACKADPRFIVYEKGNLPQTVKRGDILFWLWSGNLMTTSSSKHVGLAEYDSSGSQIYCLGGNQKDKICTLAYDRSKLYAVARLK